MILVLYLVDRYIGFKSFAMADSRERYTTTSSSRESTMRSDEVDQQGGEEDCKAGPQLSVVWMAMQEDAEETS